jgi:hypothetical protein
MGQSLIRRDQPSPQGLRLQPRVKTRMFYPRKKLAELLQEA